MEQHTYDLIWKLSKQGGTSEDHLVFTRQIGKFICVLGGSTVSLNGATLLGIMSNESIFLGDCKEIFTYDVEV